MSDQVSSFIAMKRWYRTCIWLQLQPTPSNVSAVCSSISVSMHLLWGRLRALENLIAVGAQLGHLRSTMETGPWFDEAESSIVSMLHHSRAQQRLASSGDRSRCLESNEIRISRRSNTGPFL